MTKAASCSSCRAAVSDFRRMQKARASLMLAANKMIDQRRDGSLDSLIKNFEKEVRANEQNYGYVLESDAY